MVERELAFWSGVDFQNNEVALEDNSKLHSLRIYNRAVSWLNHS